MASNNFYPWFYFFRISRLTFIVFFPTLFIILFLYRLSFEAGLISQARVETKKELEIIKKSFVQISPDVKKWCNSIKSGNEVYFITTNDGINVCNELIIQKKNNELFETTLLNESYVLRKNIPTSIYQNKIQEFDRIIYVRVVPISLLSFIIYLFLFYRLTKPLGIILSKVEKFKEAIPFNKSLELFYKRDEWGALEEALNKADSKLQAQVLEAKKENEKNATILESINDAIIAVDRFDSILFYNTKFKNNFIVEREGQEINKKLWHMFKDQVLVAFREVLITGTPQSLKALNFPQSNYPDHFFDLTITPLKSASGSIDGSLGVFYNITEFKKAEQMRVDFVANVSHEIRTPLTSIKGFSQILQIQSGKVDPSLHPFLEKIVANTERMISLFNDLLNLSVIESKNDIKLEEFSLSDLLEQVVDNTKANFQGKKIIFNFDLQETRMTGDFRLMEQVFFNLCDNACKYSGEEVTINILSYKKNQRLYITIQDNGPGMSKEHLSRIFERFYRIDASRESLRGTGLGLSIVKQIISKHHGKIAAESEGPGLGTRFIIELP